MQKVFPEAVGINIQEMSTGKLKYNVVKVSQIINN